AIILDRLRREFPSHGVVTEESGEYPGTSSTYRWYVDPLDGSKNFARGYPAFAVSLALACGEQLIVGVVFDPTRGELFLPVHGAGASCNARRIRVSTVSRLEECLVGTGYPSAARHADPNVALLHRVSMTTQGLRRTGSSALDLSYVACGRLDAFWDI